MYKLNVNYIKTFVQPLMIEFRVTAKGKTGHASIMFEDTAAQKIHHVMNKLLQIRTEQKQLLESNPDIELGEVTSVNMTMLGVSFGTILLA